MSNRIRVLKILEVFWLITGCLSLSVFTYKAYSEGILINRNYFLLAMGCISMLMFLLRRKKRKGLQAEEKS